MQVSGGPAPGARLVTLREWAPMAGRAESTVLIRWRREPGFPLPARPSRGPVPALYHLASLEAWLEEKTRDAPQRVKPRMAARIPPGTAGAIIAGYRSGMSQRAVADRCRVTPETVRRVLARAGVRVRGKAEAQSVRWALEPEQRRNLPEPALARLPREQAVARYEGGESAAALGREYGVSAQTVQRAVTLAGRPVRGRAQAQQAQAGARGRRAPYVPRGTPVPWDQMTAPERAAAVRHRYEAGQSMPQIGRALRIGAETVRRALLDAGVTPRGGRPRAARGLDEQEIADRYYRGGESVRALADAYGTGRTVITDILSRHGVPRRGFSAAARARSR